MKAQPERPTDDSVPIESREDVLRIQPFIPDNVEWVLPPSKSHLIRWLLIAAIRDKPTVIRKASPWSEDSDSMRRCLNQLGMDIPADDEFTITPVAFTKPEAVLNARNSGTSCRFLMALAACLDFEVVIDGDMSLRTRSHLTLLSALERSGAEIDIESETGQLPVMIRGPMASNSVRIDTTDSSQPYSALLLTRSLHKMSIEVIGEGVSENHSNLSKRLLEDSSDVVIIPRDSSMAAFARLFEIVHAIDVPIKYPIDNLGHKLPQDIPQIMDLKHRNDLLPPLAAIMALGNGGTIVNAKHASFKESNRIESTHSLLKEFGMSCEMTDDGLVIEGNQSPTRPDYLVDTFGDHRIQMVAVILATKVGADIIGSNLHKVADPEFIKRLQNSGAIIESTSSLSK